jgi:5-methylcytosine-specific restriction enzyme subunit McrC
VELRLVEGADPIVAELSEEVGDALSRSKVVIASRLGSGMWEIAPNTRVGVAVVAGVTVWIKPKVDIARILYLLGYARNPGWQADTVQYAEVGDLLVVLGRIFCDQVERSLELGVLQGYAEVNDSLTVLRGRLRDQEQLTRRFGIAIPLLVRFDDYTKDIPENQLLRGAVELLLRIPGLAARERMRLRRLRQVLAEVTSPTPGIPPPRWVPSRLNERYQTSLWLADMLLRRNALNHAAGDIRASGFLVDMAKVFEDYVSASLPRALKRFGGWVRPQDRHDLDAAGQIAMKPDLVWYVDAEPAAVVDAKYKAEKPAGFPNADLYQMLAYCTALNLTQGHLVYAKGNQVEISHTVRHVGIEIHIHVLDLSALPSELELQVDLLANRIREATAVGSSFSTETPLPDFASLVKSEGRAND